MSCLARYRVAGVVWGGFALLALGVGGAWGQATAARPAGSASAAVNPKVDAPVVEPKLADPKLVGSKVADPKLAEPRLAAAENYIGRALILRGFYAGAELAYDAAGRVKGSPKVVDWTLAGMNLEAVSERAGELQLEGTRVAVRYNLDAHTFDRHALKGEPLRVRVAEPADVAGVEAALAEIFSTGIDPALQRSMPDPWRHYFEPGPDWGKDSLAGVEIVRGGKAAGVTVPEATQQAQAEYTAEARQDRVEGSVLLRLVVDAAGVPRRIAVARPLGYGLDAAAAAALARWKFEPGQREGKAMAFELTVNQQFTVVAALGH